MGAGAVCCGLEKTQELLHKLERAPRLHGTFVRVARIMEERKLPRPVVVDRRELPMQDPNRLHDQRILGTRSPVISNDVDCIRELVQTEAEVVHVFRFVPPVDRNALS